MPAQIIEELFGTLDFAILGSSDYKEDSVREDIVLPILHALGYSSTGLNKIIRSKSLLHPFVNIGSKKRNIYLIPDYILAVENKPAWVLDAKSPNENITSGENVEQAYSYAIHPDVRVKCYALSNGREFSLFDISFTEPVLYFQVSEIAHYWQKLYGFLSPQSFIAPIASTGKETTNPQEAFDYSKIRPISEIKDLKKQSAKRHFGVHPYFTKQVWNVVQEYIKTYSRPGDLVLDPYGGSGVTLVEALILGRRAIQVDINPLANFIVQNLINPIDINELSIHFNKICEAFNKNAPNTESEIALALKKYDYPKGIKLPTTSDVSSIEQLFSPIQLAQLAYLKHLIKQVKDEDIQGVLLLMFSGLLNKINLTYHASSQRTKGQGDSSVFRYYRYRLAPEPATLDLMKYFKSRFKKIIEAKKEIAPFINLQTLENATLYKASATDLSFIGNQTVDYIYTDPPYGSKIQYLDLSTMWTSWLDLEVTQQDYDMEAIEGGELRKSRDIYSTLLTKSIQEMYRVLKFDRWMSFVFSHKDPAYWHLIVESAENAGFEYMGADNPTIKPLSRNDNILLPYLKVNS